MPTEERKPLGDIRRTPCEAAVERALQLAYQILSGEVDSFEGGRQIAWLGSADCYDFLNEVDVVDEMAAMWQLVDDAEHRQILGLPPVDNRAELSEEIRSVARALIAQYGLSEPR